MFLAWHGCCVHGRSLFVMTISLSYFTIDVHSYIRVHIYSISVWINFASIHINIHINEYLYKCINSIFHTSHTSHRDTATLHNKKQKKKHKLFSSGKIDHEAILCAARHGRHTKIYYIFIGKRHGIWNSLNHMLLLAFWCGEQIDFFPPSLFIIRQQQEDILVFFPVMCCTELSIRIVCHLCTHNVYIHFICFICVLSHLICSTPQTNHPLL